MIDMTITVPALITALLAFVGGIVWLIRMEGRVNAANTKLEEFTKLTSAMEGLILLHKEQFHEYQLQAAKEFMTQAAFAEIKRELISEIGRMEGRLEAQIERLSSRPVSQRRSQAGS